MSLSLFERTTILATKKKRQKNRTIRDSMGRPLALKCHVMQIWRTLYLSLYKIVPVCPKPFKLRFWFINTDTLVNEHRYFGISALSSGNSGISEIPGNLLQTQSKLHR